jgi:hypothetical protein
MVSRPSIRSPQETGPEGPGGEDNLLDEAARNNLSARETLALLCEREIARKDHRRIDMALKLAHFPAVKDLSSFDYDAEPSVDPKQIRDLAAGTWIANGENLLLLGPPGTGKSPVSMARRVRCHGEDEGAFAFDEVIADRTRFPPCREPGQGVGTDQAGSGSKTLRGPRIVS